MNEPSPSLPPAFLSWENASQQLATALSTYLQSCVFLDESYKYGLPAPQLPITRINYSLETLHQTHFDGLSRSHVTLARVRNRISSQCYSFPNEVLREIFMDVVFAPGPDDDLFPSTRFGINRIYRRLHSILGVCSTWRHVGLALKELWSIIPAATSELDFPPETMTSMSLHRSHALTSNHPHLHLAVVLSSLHAPLPLFTNGIIPQFTSINIESRFTSPAYDISKLLKALIPSQSPSILSELSICQDRDSWERYEPPPCFPKQHDYVGYHMSEGNRNFFMKLVGSLSSLRLRSTYIYWDAITFSHKLANLYLQSVILGKHSELNKFLRVLESAPELRVVKLISVVVLRERSSGWKSRRVKVVFPKLNTLVLDGLAFTHTNSKSPSPQDASLRAHKAGPKDQSESDEGDASDDEWNQVDMGPVLKLLAHYNIHSLYFDSVTRDSQRADSKELTKILEALPTLKSLVLVDWKLGTQAILSLQRSNYHRTFPDLEELCLVGGYISDVELLPRVAASHSLQKMVLDSDARNLGGGDVDLVLQRLRSTVPHFRLVDGIQDLDDFNYYRWRLW